MTMTQKYFEGFDKLQVHNKQEMKATTKSAKMSNLGGGDN